MDLTSLNNQVASPIDPDATIDTDGTYAWYYDGRKESDHVDASDADEMHLLFKKVIDGVPDHGTLHIKPGVYTIGTSPNRYYSGIVLNWYPAIPVMEKNIHIFGSGVGSTTLKLADGEYTAGHPAVLVMVSSGGQCAKYAASYDAFTLANMTLDGNVSNQTPDNTDGAGCLLTQGGYDTGGDGDDLRYGGRFFNLEIKNSPNSGAYFGYAAGGRENKAIIQNIFTHDNGGWGFVGDTLRNSIISNIFSKDDAQEAACSASGMGIYFMGASDCVTRSDDNVYIHNINTLGGGLMLQQVRGYHISGMTINNIDQSATGLYINQVINSEIDVRSIRVERANSKYGIYVIGENTDDLYIRGGYISAGTCARIGTVGHAPTLDISDMVLDSSQFSSYIEYGTVNFRNIRCILAASTASFSVQANAIVTIDNCYADAKQNGVYAVGTLTHNNTRLLGLENRGYATSIGDGGIIAHGLVATPTQVIITGSVAGEMLTVTGLNATNITVAIKQDDGSAGTSQTVYWWAKI